jgi:hypothetical protein
MQHIVITGRFAEFLLTLTIPPSLWISMPISRRVTAILKPCCKFFPAQLSNCKKKYTIKIMQTY